MGLEDQYMSLEELAERGVLNVVELNDSLESAPLTSLDDNDLADIERIIFRFPSLIDTVATYPFHYKKFFDQSTYYFDVKGKFSPKMRDSQVRTLMKFRGNTGRFVDKNSKSAKEPHQMMEEEFYSLDEIQKHFKFMDIYDGRRFKAVLNGTSMALHCPDIVPKNVKKAFGHRWYNVKQFETEYAWGPKSVRELKDDGRKEMFTEGISKLIHYLRQNR